MRAFEPVAFYSKERDARELRRELFAERGEYIADRRCPRERFERADQSVEDVGAGDQQVGVDMFDRGVRDGAAGFELADRGKLLLLFALEGLNAGGARLEQRRHRAELGFGGLRLAVRGTRRRLRLALVRNRRFEIRRGSLGFLARTIDLRLDRLKLVFDGRARGSFLVACGRGFRFRRFQLLDRCGEIGDLLLYRLRLFLFRLELSTRGVELRARVVQ